VRPIVNAPTPRKGLPTVPLFGAHLSVAGGFHNALLAARRYDCPAVQVFTKAPNQWSGRPIGDDEARLFHRTLRQTKVRFPIGHDSYLINLASPDADLYRKSVEAFADELGRAEKLRLRYLVTHPGAHLGSGEEEGLRRVAEAIDEVHRRCADFRVRILLETTAGQGTCLGHRFEHLRRILELIAEPERLGVCLDTCHVFAAGYALAPEAEYRATFREFDRQIGVKRLKAFHVNDSLKPQGSRVDRHAHVGQGHLGLEPFRLLVNDPRFRNRPMVLELPKETPECDDMDAVNLATLRELVESPA
jgi:deoxyribonuclease-4